ncbi:2-polyprenyl-3-methyl-5-hydroxy-6-metoxy-1,4-benzoquinol methylase [Photobacterium jeanii]|uniref:2-polyprenyl-3-methyl-5-hydroxy-6-metoxy-1, 4-benzoquinol methylase n=1 Tax=Photobacterium jeanii TaxID=858640 RepID=A0A178KPP2_9GAMM|nr:class I SAM-dependent methyltransferase [Photobacterium jeanii]OAN19190.1 2-polyprenyl-3-methyl-5-hydroxy-6-metoxy-1,4-benzoquinol methylase [Photobacterium jeanii]PST87198.1 class I SAM-dependent methyltransferase [Photobacterium jeanii]
MSACPLCHHASTATYAQDRLRAYFQCPKCQLIFADPAAKLTPEQELAVYQQHENNPEDQGYRRFLNRLAAPLAERLASPPLSGLDFGSGPGPTLSVMLSEIGYNVAIYDPYFANEPAVLAQRYDFVTCTEAIEHFNTPAKEWGQLVSMVKPGGWLGIMTKLATSADEFARWHYKNDPTHVSFFSRETFRFLAQRDELEVEFVGNDVILLRKTQ